MKYLVTHVSNHHAQDKADANLLQFNEMLDQRNMFEEQLAQSARSALDQRMSFNSQMAKAKMDASDQMAQAGSMQTAYNKLSCENVEQRRAAAQVSLMIKSVDLLVL